MTSEMKNLKKSIRQRLLNISRDKKEDFQLILIRFALFYLKLFELLSSAEKPISPHNFHLR
jgi:hypothetical protein